MQVPFTTNWAYLRSPTKEEDMLTIGHEVRRPGKYLGDAPVTIPVPEELETTPGIPMNQREVDWVLPGNIPSRP